MSKPGRMCKNDIAARLAERCGISQSAALFYVEQFIDVLVTHFVAGGSEVVIRGFGKIIKTQRKAFETRNPATGKRIKVSAKRRLVLRPSKELTARI